MRALALVPYPLDTTPSQRFRLEQWAPRLRTCDIELVFSPFFDGAAMRHLHARGHIWHKVRAVLAGMRRRQCALRRARDFDAVVIHRTAWLVGPTSLELAFARRGVPTVFDFDDAVYLAHGSGANRLFDWLKFPAKIPALCHRSRVVSAGSAYLAEWASQFSDCVRVVPTSIELARYTMRPREQRPGERLVVGWTGSATSLTHLEDSAPMLQMFLAQRDVELRVVSNRAPHIPGVPAVWRPWSAETEVDEIRQFDIGIKPLPDDQWSRGKCPMKELQYMALGVPVVCSAVGGSREAVSDGETGYLVSSREDWLRALSRLVDLAELRRRMGQAGRRVVEERYSSETVSRSFAEVLRTATTSASQGAAERERSKGR
jgi:glycosyltransferase involved in cell wall biosynthesis